MHGRSLVPILSGSQPDDWRRYFYYHYYEFPGAHSVRRHYGVVSDRYKLFHFYEPEMDYWTLIDREEDSQELKNVYGQSAYAGVQRELHAELDRLRNELKVPQVDPARLDGRSKRKPRKKS